ncbi:glycosyltransferase [Moellerella wisconsensis]|uniref:Family 2 glycosyltransferase n=1 Tax=Moellerella wisconsensis ATCC 35017 TaxID=1354267 RepID=A0A0N0IAR4_9GAMM|nr:glycosyltransferase [Moellerella wisconsensis]KPD03160.1 family 2 glycosyltransferase [Moellerella wisconsensis ATCC 35017]
MSFLNIFKLGLKKTKKRLKFDSQVGKFQNNLILNRKNLPTLSAVFRIKNAETYLEISVTSIAPICTEIIIVDNNSSDKSLEICYRLQEQLRDICDIKIYSYNNRLAIAGENYHNNLSESNSLAAYYTFAFSKATSDYVMKADAHLLYTPLALKKIQNKLSDKRRVIIFKGIEIYGMKLSFEKYIFKNDSTFYFVDGMLYEELKFNYKLSKWEQFTSTIITPCFIHFKRIRYINNLGSSNLVENIYK